MNNIYPSLDIRHPSHGYADLGRRVDDVCGLFFQVKGVVGHLVICSVVCLAP